MKHIHADLIKQWVDDTSIELEHKGSNEMEWQRVHSPSWNETTQYRIKPKPQPDFEIYRIVNIPDEQLIRHELRLRFIRASSTGKWTAEVVE